MFLTGRDDVPSSVRAMKAGAVDFLQKPVQADTLIAALERALAQDESQRAAREARQRLAALFATLTPREQEVFDRIVAGRLNKQIADELHTSERTAKTQRSQLMSKLGVESAAELGRLAEQRQASGLGVASLSGNELAPAPDSAPAMRTR